jgi:hypothetical protein
MPTGRPTSSRANANISTIALANWLIVKGTIQARIERRSVYETCPVTTRQLLLKAGHWRIDPVQGNALPGFRRLLAL